MRALVPCDCELAVEAALDEVRWCDMEETLKAAAAPCGLGLMHQQEGQTCSARGAHLMCQPLAGRADEGIRAEEKEEMRGFRAGVSGGV